MIPCSVRRMNAVHGSLTLQYLSRQGVQWPDIEGPIRDFPSIFPVSRKCDPERGSHETPCTAMPLNATEYKRVPSQLIPIQLRAEQRIINPYQETAYSGCIFAGSASHLSPHTNQPSSIRARLCHLLDVGGRSITWSTELEPG
jgi:hypothetical protein